METREASRKIRYILAAMGWTAKELAIEMEVNTSYIYAWKNERKRPGEENSEMLEDLYVEAVKKNVEAVNRIEEIRPIKKQPTKKKTEGKILSHRGKIKIEFPWYNYQKEVNK